MKMRQLDTEKLRKNIEDIAKFDIDENNVYGSSYAVTQNGNTLYKGFFGTSGKEGSPVDDTSVFRLASMTKPVTSFAMLLLVDKGLISLDDKVKKHLPEFENIHVIDENGIDHGCAKNDVTILHLLTHTSGFGSIKPPHMTHEQRKTISSLVEYYIGAGLDFEPMSRQSYSPYAAFDVLAAIAEKITGLDYEEFLKNEIFIPCGMSDTTFIPSHEQWRRIVTMHSKILGKSRLGHTTDGCVFESFPASHKLAGAGLVSTLDDYVRFAAMLLQKGKAGEKRLMSEKTFSLLSTPHVPETVMPGHERWGLGVRVITSDSYTLPKGSFGWSGAYGSHFWVDPENGITAVFMKNSRHDGGAGNSSAVRFEKAVYDSFRE